MSSPLPAKRQISAPQCSSGARAPAPRGYCAAGRPANTAANARPESLIVRSCVS